LLAAMPEKRPWAVRPKRIGGNLPVGPRNTDDCWSPGFSLSEAA